MLLFSFTAFAQQEQPLVIGALKGPTAMGMVQLMEEDASKGNYVFSLMGAVDEITPLLLKGELDLSAVPANLASVLYNNSNGQIQVLAINTLGVLYIVELGDSVHTAADLKGKTLFASGKGATPEYALNHVLKQNGIDPEKDVTIEWKSEHAECVAALTTTDNAIALLPQPFVTAAQAKNTDIRIALDLNTLWEDTQQDTDNKSALITGVIVGRKDVLEQKPEQVQAFLESYQNSVDFVNANTKEAADLVEKFDILPAAVAQKALPYCNIVYIDATDMKTMLSGYLAVLFEQNPKATGGQLPDEAFYYLP
ncbi:MAG: ABC transporter substrate-binding protein [Clostridiales bacterium]|nr:ABC transporter substrate-binding protein [Clostridiales bacterium]